MTDPVPTLSLVILCYRSEDFAGEFTARTLAMMERYGITSFELILVGNYVEGSGDKTPAIVRALAESDPRIRCCAEAKQGMMGWDLRSGLREARGEYVGFIDGDGQMPIDDVGRLFELIRGGDHGDARDGPSRDDDPGYDLVKTYRTARADGLSRKILTTGYNLLFRMLFPGLEARDMNAKPKIMQRAAYEKMELTADGWFVDAEIMIEALHHKMKIGELPTEFRELDRRRSFVSFGAVFEFASNLVRRRFKEFFR